jgi:xanthine dehydrogenase iron-sulfur cluster and FAD-binding subunit A
VVFVLRRVFVAYRVTRSSLKAHASNERSQALTKCQGYRFIVDMVAEGCGATRSDIQDPKASGLRQVCLRFMLGARESLDI